MGCSSGLALGPLERLEECVWVLVKRVYGCLELRYVGYVSIDLCNVYKVAIGLWVYVEWCAGTRMGWKSTLLERLKL